MERLASLFVAVVAALVQQEGDHPHNYGNYRG